MMKNFRREVKNLWGESFVFQIPLKQNILRPLPEGSGGSLSPL